VKVIDKKTTLKQKNGVDTLINEIMILSRMDNPNVIKLHEVYQDDINFYLVMDFVDGLTLRQEIQNYKYDWVSSERALRLLKQLAMGVAYLHSHGIIHRDIKPSNLMVQHDRLIIIDLGLSCFNGEQLRILPDCGTVGYMAPELFKP
jgi:serine/threonine protein kinase